MPGSANALRRDNRPCYGMATELAVREILAERGDPGYFATPYLHSLLNQLEADGHRVDDIRRELDRLLSIVYACRDSIVPTRRS